MLPSLGLSFGGDQSAVGPTTGGYIYAPATNGIAWMDIMLIAGAVLVGYIVLRKVL